MATSSQKIKSKIVVRYLPPSLTEETFLKTISAHLPNVTWKTYLKDNLSVKGKKFSIAYLNFKTEESVLNFAKEFDGHVFVDSSGNHYRISVDFALYQSIPINSTFFKRTNQIENDPDYLNFLSIINDGDGNQCVKTEQELLDILNPNLQPESNSLHANNGKTPLLEYLEQKRQEKAELFMNQNSVVKNPTKGKSKRRKLLKSSGDNSLQSQSQT
ncbi:nonsense-mediated decay UPF3 [Rozella allomycis CSF55]|uniref:Nonsense-mediated decay UPF3 n=1 Tax=Rozella allomycis (strain CSF55) TaxID=988480 RepID=A0A4P9YPY9_ROZAC|nr:nonsense-mediated decay UPF3 [Rozella allomycis CSF55]